MSLKARYSKVCVRCFRQIEIGDDIDDEGGKGWHHVECPTTKGRRAWDDSRPFSPPKRPTFNSGIRSTPGDAYGWGPGCPDHTNYDGDPCRCLACLHAFGNGPHECYFIGWKAETPGDDNWNYDEPPEDEPVELADWTNSDAF